MSSTLVYSTTTGLDPMVDVDATDDVDVAYDFNTIPEPHCFVCGRHTDHYGEHDALVAAGLAEYDLADGSVNRTAAWDDKLAAAISRAEYEALCADLDLDPYPTED